MLKVIVNLKIQLFALFANLMIQNILGIINIHFDNSHLVIFSTMLRKFLLHYSTVFEY
jgi:hypothetical protein